MPGEGRPAPAPWQPQFFRILLPGFQRRMSIPRPFNKYINRENCTLATILSPLGNSWRVEIHGDDNGLYFAKGWEEFCQAHDLYVGCFLVLIYQDEMVFRVTIFDSNSCMKDYTPVVEDDDMNNETRGGLSSLYGVRITESVEQQNDFYEQQAVGIIESIDSQEKRTPDKVESSIKGSFRITIRSHSLLKPNLHIPKVFQKNNGISSIKKVFLRDSKMRLWPTSVYHRRRRKNVHSRLGYGWAKFCSNNNVEEGDVCIFQTLPEEEFFTIHVSILKKHMLERADDLKPFQEEQCPVIGNSAIEGTTGEQKLEVGQTSSG